MKEGMRWIVSPFSPMHFHTHVFTHLSFQLVVAVAAKLLSLVVSLISFQVYGTYTHAHNANTLANTNEQAPHPLSPLPSFYG